VGALPERFPFLKQHRLLEIAYGYSLLSYHLIMVKAIEGPAGSTTMDLRSVMHAMGLESNGEEEVEEARGRFKLNPDAASLYRWEGDGPTIQNSLSEIQSGVFRVNFGYTQLGGRRTVYVEGVGYKGQCTEVPDILTVEPSSLETPSRKGGRNRSSMADQIRYGEARFEHRTTKSGEKLSVYVPANQLAKEEIEQLKQRNMAESGEEGCTSTHLSVESVGSDAATKLHSFNAGWDDTDTNRTTIGSTGSNVEQIADSHTLNIAPSD
jgi:hypothetical protein